MAQRAFKDRAGAAIRRFLCLPPLHPDADKEGGAKPAPFPPVGTGPKEGSLTPMGAGGSGTAPAPEILPESERPHTLRQALYPITILFTIGYLAMEAREFLWGPALSPKGVSPEVYGALMGIFAFDQEIRRWKGAPDNDVLTAEFVIGAWWLSLFVAWMAVNLVAAGTYALPQDMPRVCVELLAVFGLKSGTAYLRSASGAKTKASREIILDYVRRHGRITSDETAQLLGVAARTARYHLSRLVAEGLLKRAGDPTDPGAYYELAPSRP